ncbi:MAG: hypothetical protein GXY76_00990, partial [Chloroflexi bacterium]|nr:hypothetical protein [Chloroflexota bacterium]
MRTRWLVILAVALAALALSGCGARALLSNVTIEPGVISPNADGTDDVAAIRYKITDNARVSMYFVDGAGARHAFREDVRRSPSKDEYVAFFGGSIDGRLLPDGDYTCVIEAKAEDGRAVREEKPLVIRGGDKDRIEIRNLVIAPNVFTPNRD